MQSSEKVTCTERRRGFAQDRCEAQPQAARPAGAIAGGKLANSVAASQDLVSANRGISVTEQRRERRIQLTGRGFVSHRVPHI